MIVVFTSCKNNNVYDEFDNQFNENRWDKNDIRSFEFNCESDLKDGSIYLHIGHIYDFQFEAIPVQIKITHPNGVIENLNIQVQMKNSEGKDIGDCSGDVCDLYYPIRKNIDLKKGKYVFEVKNEFAHSFLPNILGIGIQILK